MVDLPGVPAPTVREQQYLHGLCLRMDVQNDLLTQILGRLPQEPQVHIGTVELREPDPPRSTVQPADGQGPPALAELTEPAATAAAPRPARRNRKTPKGAT